MTESNILAGNVVNIFLIREIWMNTRGQDVKESNTLAAYANIEQLQGVILLNITGEYMKGSNTLADNVANNYLTREVWIHTIG